MTPNIATMVEPFVAAMTKNRTLAADPLDAIRLAELSENFRQMCLDRRHRNTQCLGDLFIAGALAEKTKNLTLTRGQPLQVGLCDRGLARRQIAGSLIFIEKGADRFSSRPHFALLHLVDHLEQHIGSHRTRIAFRAATQHFELFRRIH